MEGNHYVQCNSEAWQGMTVPQQLLIDNLPAPVARGHALRGTLYSTLLEMTLRQPALLQVLLMIFLGAPELGGGDDLGHNGPWETTLRGVA